MCMRQSMFVNLCFSKIVDATILFRLQVIQSVTLFPQGKSCDALELSTVMSFISSPMLRAFGNAMAGYLAKLMGLPIDRIVCATNANDIVPPGSVCTPRYPKSYSKLPQKTKGTRVSVSGYRYPGYIGSQIPISGLKPSVPGTDVCTRGRISMKSFVKSKLYVPVTAFFHHGELIED